MEAVNSVQDRGVCSIANYNSSNQIVISGEKEPTAAASRFAVERGGKAIPLNVSGAWHCSLMAEAQKDFRAVLVETPFREPRGDIIFNVTATRERNVDTIREIMWKQLCSPVRWYESILKMAEDGVDTFIEVGPGKVLQGLVKRILPKGSSYRLAGVEDVATLRTFLDKS
jgi:[acyl-carrier-protein] S-malonyltransferase